MSTEPLVHVIPARTLPIGDRTLHQLRNLAHDAARGQATEGECEFVLIAVGPLLDELIAWRGLAAGAIQPEAMLHYLPGVR